jgi:DNA-binding winged helix-turn-helix (wHTH) protein
MTAAPSLKADVVRLRFDGFELDEANARLTRAGRPVPLPPKPFAVLCTLVRSPRMLVTKNALLDSVWGHRFVSDSVLKSAISEVRAALGDDPKQPRYIETVSRHGYRFIAASAGAQPQTAGVLEAVTSLCRSDAALADLIRSVATVLERERLLLNESWRAA